MMQENKITNIEVMPQVRNKGWGDYFERNGVTRIEVKDTGNEIFNKAIAIHELIEELDTRLDGIDEEIINQFDADFEEERSLGLHGEFDEPGMDFRCVYKKHHEFATSIEKLIIEHFGYTWEQYERELQKS